MFENGRGEQPLPFILTMKITSTFQLSLQILLRHKMLPLAIFAIIAVLISSMLAAEFGGRQPATVAMDVGLSILKLVLPLFMVLQAQELFSKEFDRKFYQLTLTYPTSRITWFAGRFLALLFVTVVLLVLGAGILGIEVSVISKGYTQQTPASLGVEYWLSILFIALDQLVLLALACFLAIVASTPSFVLVGTLGIMLIARSYSTILELLASTTGLVDNAEAYRSNLGLLSYLLPDLGALDVRMIALYGDMKLLPSDWPIFTGSAIFYALSLLSVTVWLFTRKQFA